MPDERVPAAVAGAADPLAGRKHEDPRREVRAPGEARVEPIREEVGAVHLLLHIWARGNGGRGLVDAPAGELRPAQAPLVGRAYLREVGVEGFPQDLAEALAERAAPSAPRDCCRSFWRDWASRSMKPMAAVTLALPAR